MDRIRIRGGARLNGEIPISGAKNAALKLMAASLLTAEPLTLTNVPRLADVRAMAELLRSFGVSVEVTRNVARLGGRSRSRCRRARSHPSFASYDMVRKMRASFQVLAPLLARAWRSQGVAARRLRHRRAAGRSHLEALSDGRQGRTGRWLCRGHSAASGLKGAEIRISLRLCRRHRNRDDGGNPGQGHHRDRQCGARARDRRSWPIA